jgi:ATP-dependent DNA helicase RecQ
VRQADLLHGLLAGLGFNVGKHHGRMPPKQRHESEHKFIAGELHAIVGTNAFGAGIDKADIRFVIHYATPESLDSYYQEVRRAGGDGKPSRGALLYRLEDRRSRLLLRDGECPRSDEIRTVYDALTRTATEGRAAPIAAVKEAASSVNEPALRIVLQLLKQLGVVRERRGARIALLKPDLAGDALDELWNRYKGQHTADHERLNKMLKYAHSTRCRWRLLLEYFGQAVPWERCGSCDNCRSPVADQIVQTGPRSEAADG